LPEGDVPAPAGSGVSKSAASRHFVALSAARMRAWMASDLSKLDPLVAAVEAATRRQDSWHRTVDSIGPWR